jgi:hypothetical protein
VIIHGEQIYLGKYGSTKSHEKYSRLIAEFSTIPSPPLRAGSRGSISVSELVLAYRQSGKSHYVKDGKPTGTLVA